MAAAVTRAQVLGFRVHAQQLDRSSGGTLADTAVLDIGVQDTGPDGARWALAIRGVDESSPAGAGGAGRGVRGARGAHTGGGAR